MWRLRQPDGCPWDKAQTHSSITQNMVEETYEAVEAIREGNDAHLVEELGDMLEQILLQAQIGADEASFTIDDVCRGINEKLVRRHPHIFGDPAEFGAVDSEGKVLDIWDDVKKQERADGFEPKGLLDSVPRSFPA
ncbi:MAG: MazG family protein, partial [Atopobiaceae bacterium]|nr:MazG family protein [Atopobiaceae bacterium]